MSLTIKIINTEKEYQSALKRASSLMEKAKLDESDQFELELCRILTNHYENEHVPISIDKIEFRQEQLSKLKSSSNKY